MMQNNYYETIINLIRAGLKGQNIKLPDDFNIDTIYSVAKAHQMMNILLYGALSAELDDTHPVIKKLYSGSVTELAIHERQMYEFSALCHEFDKYGISYMPLKGVLLKDLYPRPEMRTMGDVDILIRVNEYDRIKPLLVSLGYVECYESNHEIVWKKSGMLLELHKRLIPSYNKDYSSYFGDGWSRAIRLDNESSRYILPPEDEFVFVFTHFAKHYRDGGIGMKQIVDLWLLLIKRELNIAYIKRELSKLNLLEFYLNIRNMIDYWFEDGKATDITKFISESIIKSGAFGTADSRNNAATIRAVKGRRTCELITKVVVLIKKLFPSRSALCHEYKYLNKAPILLPIAWFSRLFSAIFFHRERLTRSVEQVKRSSSQMAANYEKSLHYVGLDFNFKEKE